ncbi:hypothetical protein GOP47_0005870 [Adiantum capillus-veneris]|uniref:Uncharacterized protein n=1 Tax=Adiantum capillus-veneris TaxID=13818 RepID=A0A9D4V6W2_ADICA|nr:hypothetical protein GOP47_0005870 [Adiantum capillus-veneris]
MDQVSVARDLLVLPVSKAGNADEGAGGQSWDWVNSTIGYVLDGVKRLSGDWQWDLISSSLYSFFCAQSCHDSGFIVAVPADARTFGVKTRQEIFAILVWNPGGSLHLFGGALSFRFDPGGH